MVTKKEDVQEKEQVEQNELQDDEVRTPVFVNKQRYWQAVIWINSLVEVRPEWEEEIAESLQLPFAYCIHDKDVKKDGSPRDPHMHLILAFPNTTTYKHALTIFKEFAGKAVNTCEACKSITYCYNYLIHDTDDARKKKKYQYSERERVRGNNFDIGFYEQISLEEKRELLGELIDFIIEKGFTNLIDFTIECKRDDRFSSVKYKDVRISYTTTLDKFCAANYKKLQNGGFSRRWNNGPEQASHTYPTPIPHPDCCPHCGSVEVLKNGKTAGKRPRFKCKDCGKSWAI